MTGSHSSFLSIAASALCGLLLASATTAGASQLGSGLSLLQRSYLFEEELDAERLLKEALHYAERRIPALHVHDLDPRGHFVEAGGCSLRLEPPPTIGLNDLQRPLGVVVSLLERCTDPLPEKLGTPESVLLAGVLYGLDPYTNLMDQRRQTEHSIQYRGQLAGIGARIGLRENHLTLITVYEDSPAYGAGLRDDDRVVRIDELSAVNILVGDAVERIRGAPGSDVILTIQREGEDEPRAVTVTRGLVTIPSVTAKRRDSAVVYAEITHFSQTTAEDFRRVVGQAVGRSAEGVIVDLRHNSGGSMLGAASIGDMFLGSGVLITTAGRGGHPVRGLTPQVRAKLETPFADLPVIFLTSPRTASGSELLAASLRNNNRALIIGERTFGKGTVQKTYRLDEDSTMKLTVGHFLPNGQPIPGGGLVPDIEFVTYRFGSENVWVPFVKAIDDLPFWLRLPAWAEGSPLHARYTLATGLQEPDPPDEKAVVVEVEKAEDGGDDPAVAVAEAVIRDFGSVSASRTLASAQSFLQARVADHDADLRAFMKTRDLDWSDGQPPTAVEALRLEVDVEPPLRAGQTSEIRVRVANNGEQPFYRLRGVLESSSSALNRRAVLFGKVDAGGSGEWKLEAEPSAAIGSGRLEVEVVVSDDRGVLSTLGPVLLPVQGAGRPHLGYRVRVNEGEEEAELSVAIELTNRGEAAATDVRARLEHPLDGSFEIVKGDATVPTLEAGESTTLQFAVRMLSTSADEVRAKLLIASPGFDVYLNTDFPLVIEDGNPDWHLPPQIVCEGFRPLEDGTFSLHVSVVDDSGLRRVAANVDGDPEIHVEPTAAAATRVELDVPWNPANGVRHFQITATDNEGLEGIYRADL